MVDPASSHMLVSKIKPCMSQYKLLYGETANGSLTIEQLPEPGCDLRITAALKDGAFLMRQ